MTYRPRRLGRDDEGEPIRTARELIDQLRYVIMDLPTDEHQRLLDFFKALADEGNLEESVSGTVGNHERWVGNESRDRSRRQGRDNPPEFPGRPRPGGSMDPIREAQDRSRRQAQDAAAAEWDRTHPAPDARRDADFRKRFPNASRIRSGWSLI
jgi:hypothetical protein